MATQIDTMTVSPGDATATPAGTSVLIAPSDGRVSVLYFGTSGPTHAHAASPFTTWAKALIGASTGRNSQGWVPNTGDNIQAIVTSPANGPYYFTLTRSGNSFSQNAVTATGDPNNAGSTGNGASMWVGKDPQGRLWYVGVDDALATYQPAAARMSTGGAWTVDTTLEAINLGEQNRRGVAAGIIGNYLVVVYDSGSGALRYRRLDVSVASLGSWSAAAAISGVSGISTSSILSLRAIPGGSTGMLAYSDSGGLKALTYNATTDSWGSVDTVSSATSDKHPVLIPGATGVMYAVWSEFAAANSYAIVGKAYNGSWGTKSTLIASGNNALWPNGAYYATGNKIQLVWTQGTASPWAVMFESVTPPALPSSGTQQDIYGTGQAATSASASLTVSKLLGGSGSSVTQASVSVTVSRKLAGVFAASSNAQVALTVTKLIAGNAVVQTDGAVDLSVGGAARLYATATVQAVAQAVLTVAKKITANAQAQVSAQLVLSTEKLQDIYGTADAHISASVTITRTVPLAGQAQGQTGGSIVLTVRKQLAGAGQAHANGAVTLTVVDMHYREPSGEVTLLATFTASVAMADDPTADIELLPAPEGTVE